MTTIKQLHDGWAAAAVPSNATQIQRQELERAFYAGTHALFTLFVGELAELTNEQAEAAMGATQKEIQDYFRLLLTIPRGKEGPSQQ